MIQTLSKHLSTRTASYNYYHYRHRDRYLKHGASKTFVYGIKFFSFQLKMTYANGVICKNR